MKIPRIEDTLDTLLYHTGDKKLENCIHTCIMVHVVLRMTFSFSMLCKSWSHDYCEHYFNRLLFVCLFACIWVKHNVT